MGIKFFKGKFFYCVFNDDIPKKDEYIKLIITKQDCFDYGGDWIRRIASFDNIGYAIMTLIKCATTEGWSEIM